MNGLEVELSHHCFLLAAAHLLAIILYRPAENEQRQRELQTLPGNPPVQWKPVRPTSVKTSDTLF